MTLILISRGVENDMTPNIAMNGQPPGTIAPNIPWKKSRLFLLVSQGVYSSSLVLFPVPGGEEDDKNSQAVFTHPVILLLISWKGEGGITLGTAGREHAT